MRFLSCEPLLSAVALTRWTNPECQHCSEVNNPIRRDSTCENCGETWIPLLSWVIAGCESGPGARLCDVAWLRALRDQCAAAGVAFWLKQAEDGFHGENIAPITAGEGSKRKPGGLIELPYLDGVQHAAFPEVS